MGRISKLFSYKQAVALYLLLVSMVFYTMFEPAHAGKIILFLVSLFIYVLQRGERRDEIKVSKFSVKPPKSKPPSEPPKLNLHKAANKIQDFWTENGKCPFCGKDGWTMADMLGTMQAASLGEMFFGSKMFPFVIISCRNCGYTVLINALISETWKLFRAEEKKDGNQADVHAGDSRDGCHGQEKQRTP